MNTVDAYAKTEINNLLLAKTDDLEVYGAIGQKANTSDTYTKVQTDTFLDAKADETTMTGFLNLKADATNIYTQVQIEQNLAGTAQLDDVLNLLQLTKITGGGHCGFNREN